MQALYERGIKIPEIARRFGITKQRVSQILNRKPTSHVPPPARKPRSSKPRRPLTIEEVRAIITQRQAGSTIQAVAELFDVPYSTVYRAVSGRAWSDVTGIVAYQPHQACDERIRAQLARLREEENV